LSGAGLPGVPVNVIIDQTNLGFLEMPNAANGYRRLVLKSHANHDKITIHWTVAQ
jgi:16S rRNA G527 N7-methylase RsmG